MMDVRVRALLTRIQTMRTSTMVAVGVLAGLLLIFYIKETDYRKRATVKARHSHDIEKLVGDSVQDSNHLKSSVEKRKSVGFIEPRESEQTDIQAGKEDEFVTDSTSSTMSPSTSTTMDYSGSENETENISQENAQDQIKQGNNSDSDLVKPDIIGDVDHNDNEDDVNTTQSPTTTDSYEVDEVTKTINDKADEESEFTENRENIVEKMDDIEKQQIKSVQPIIDEKQVTEISKPQVIETRNELPDEEQQIKSVQPVMGDKQVTEISKRQVIEMKNEVPDTSIENTQNIQKNGGVLLDILRREQQLLQAQSDLTVNRIPLHEQIPENPLLNEPDLKFEKSENPIEVPELTINSIVQRDLRKEMPSETNDGPNEEETQVQMLARKYSGTLNETDLPRQNETYTKRLRNKLVQTGRYDLMDSKDCKKRLPTCLIVGVMKAGTEAFSTFLGVHPQVAMQFGYAAMVFFSSSQFDNGYDWYRERMMCSTKDQVTMEKSPQYFSSSLAPKRIHDMDPEMKLIVLVRDPIARALSHFLQQKSSNPDRLMAQTFEECVYNKKTKTVISDSPYVLQSAYSVILKRWLQYFPYKQILIIDGDTFKKNPTRSLSKTESFLGIDHSISKDRLYFNEEKGFYCLKINSTLPEDLEMSCFGSEKGRAHPAIEPEVEDALLKYFQPFNEEFTKLTGMEMRWKK